MVIGAQCRCRHDPLQHALVFEPVLAKAFTRVVSREGHASNCASAQMLQRKPANLPLAIDQGQVGLNAVGGIERMGSQPTPHSPGQPATLAESTGQQTAMVEPSAAPCLHFHQQQPLRFSQHQVQLTPTAAPVAIQQAPLAAAELSSHLSLGFGTPCHGHQHRQRSAFPVGGSRLSAALVQRDAATVAGPALASASARSAG